MALKDILYIAFEKPYCNQDVHKWLEYLSLHTSSVIRLPQGVSRGTLQMNGVTLDFVCHSPASGPIVGYVFRPDRTINGKLRKNELAALREIRSYTKAYEKERKSELA